MIPFLFREVESTWATPPKLLHILYNTKILSWEMVWDRGATNTGAKRMEEDTLLIQTVPARVALRHYSQEKMGGGGGGGGWQQTIHDKPENTMSILIICLTGSSLNVQHSNCFFHVFSFFPFSSMSNQQSIIWLTSIVLLFLRHSELYRLTLSQEPLCMTDEGSSSELTHYKLLCTWVAAFGSAAGTWRKPTVENPKACADVWLTLSHISRSSIQKVRILYFLKSKG